MNCTGFENRLKSLNVVFFFGCRLFSWRNGRATTSLTHMFVLHVVVKQAVYRRTALLVRRSTPDESRHWDFDDASIFAQVTQRWGKTVTFWRVKVFSVSWSIDRHTSKADSAPRLLSTRRSFECDENEFFDNIIYFNAHATLAFEIDESASTTLFVKLALACWNPFATCEPYCAIKSDRRIRPALLWAAWSMREPDSAGKKNHGRRREIWCSPRVWRHPGTGGTRRDQ